MDMSSYCCWGHRFLATLLLALQTTCFLPFTASLPSIEFRIENAMPDGNLKDLTFKSRITLPYGPDLYQRSPPQTAEEQPYAGYGVGMGAAEEVMYDHVHHYLYAMSDQGYIIVADYQDPVHPRLTEMSFPTEDKKLGAIQICPNQGRLLVSLEDLGRIDLYSLVDRATPTRPPRLLQSIDAGSNVKGVLANKDCSLIVVGNTNKGEGLNQGAITIIQDFQDKSKLPKTTTIPLDYNEWDDAYLLRRGLNMPLTKKALEYWDVHSQNADDFDFTNIRENYRSAIFLEPERLSWNGPEETELLVNMQENNGLLRINMTDFRPVAVAGYGLKDHSVVPIDINSEDKRCDLRKYDSVFAMRNPDAIQTVRYNDKFYVITANEGHGGKAYEDWEEQISTNDLFGAKFSLQSVQVPKYIFDSTNPLVGHSALFNDGCKAQQEQQGGGSACLSKVDLSVGSNAIDYESDPSNPIFYRMVLFGGRGWSIYELPEDPDDLLKLVFDSADSTEKDGCEYFPWSHNGIQHDKFAPIMGANNSYWKSLEDDPDDRDDLINNNYPEEDGCEDQGDGTPGACPLSGTVDAASNKEGAAIENVIIGQACGRLVAAMATELTSVAMLFDITDITSPNLIKVFHLTPASEFKGAGLAYNDGELGEIDPESGVILRADQSPSGKAGILWAGAHSGTVSWWEFECEEEETQQTNSKLRGNSSSAATFKKVVGFRLSIVATVAMVLLGSS